MRYILILMIFFTSVAYAESQFKSLRIPNAYPNPQEISNVLYTHRFVVRDDSHKTIHYYRKKFKEVFKERYLVANRFAGVVVVYLDNAIAGDKELFENIVRSTNE